MIFFLHHVHNMVICFSVQYAASNVILVLLIILARAFQTVFQRHQTGSEDMVKCMVTIFCKLGEPPAANIGLSSSSMSAFSSQYQCDEWSASYGKDSSFDTRLENSFNVEGLKEFSGPYSTMVEVSCMYRESQKLGDVEYMLQNFRLVLIPSFPTAIGFPSFIRRLINL
ncbi:uncharacterized protein LOC130821305 [Amaranthus tricolor]|uniref:uncharacterized protein LOC130821305 n=1 Tax=Amaranthus tricolor TaxID=29722 RepID=UPI002582A988|nr:uncharacterized protein LOC130821305 [Amaranthus tricolor]